MLSETQRSLVYVITNTKNGKKYIGSSQNPNARFQYHMSRLRHGKHFNKDLQKDFDLYGECFEISIECEKTHNNQDSEEYQLMKKYKTYDPDYGYNNQDWAMNPTKRDAGLSYKKSNYQGKATTKETDLFLSKNIRYMRKKLNLSQTDLCKMFGYESFSTVQRWETNDHIPPLRAILEMAKLLSITVDDFVYKDLEKLDAKNR